MIPIIGNNQTTHVDVTVGLEGGHVVITYWIGLDGHKLPLNAEMAEKIGEGLTKMAALMRPAQNEPSDGTPPIYVLR